jgi:hypothetical protein
MPMMSSKVGTKMLKFISHNEIEFADEESLEVFVRTLPLSTPDQVNLLERETVTDTEDQINVTGAKSVTHKFSIEGEE